MYTLVNPGTSLSVHYLEYIFGFLLCCQSRKEEALRKRRNIPDDPEPQASLGPGFTLDSLVAKAQSSNHDEQFSAVQATR